MRTLLDVAINLIRTKMKKDWIKVENFVKIHFKETVDGYHRKFRHTLELRLPKILKGNVKFNDYHSNS